MSRETASFSASLRKLRQAAALSQEELATRAGLSLRGISDLERGVRRAPHLTTVRLLADALALSPVDRSAFLAAARPISPADPPVGAPVHPPPLPMPLTSLIGRERELAALVALMGRADTRLVTLTGTGGVGKTRLALEAGTRLRHHFDDGVVFVELAPLSDVNLVIPTLAHALGVRERAGQHLMDTLFQFLARKRMLLLLDNFEQLLDAAPIVSSLLAAGSQVKVLVTSRAPLRLRGERAFPVSPLAIPDAQQAEPAQELTQVEAVRLFVERAQAAKPDFALSDENAAAVAEMCRRLDGLPLAIELAAARIKLLPPRALLERFGDRLTVLTGGPRDAPLRQRTLRDTIAWSHDLLAAEAQVLFRRLGVFAGGFTLDAADAVATPSGDQDSLEGLSTLVDESLLRQTEEAGGDPRFGMLETVREFALEQLEASGEGDSVREAHACFFLCLAEESADRLLGPEQPMWVARLTVDLDNLRAALAWSLAANPERTEQGLRLVVALWPFWFWQSQFAEARRWMDQALLRSGQEPSPLRAATLFSAAIIAHHLGDYAAAGQLAADGVATARACSDAATEGRSLIPLSLVAGRRGEHQTAAAHAAAALAIFRQLNDVHWIAMALTRLAVETHGGGDPVAAKPFHEEALRLWRELGFATGAAMALGNLGDVARDQGDLAQAAARLRESLQISWALRIDWIVVEDLFFMADVARLGGRLLEAARLFGAAERLRETIGHALFGNLATTAERSIAATRSSLGAEQFAVAWDRGHALLGEEAIAAALEVAAALAEDPGTLASDRLCGCSKGSAAHG